MLGSAGGFRLDVTAEGVETEEQLALRRDKGYLLGRPMDYGATIRQVA
ncbi:MAG: hypothetical protein JWP04_3564 [Belnapia sp.]|nr:hypothetical protein [Belnapia sp.]